MSYFLSILIGVWLLKGAINILIGMVQITVGVIGGIFGCLCFTSVFLVEIIEVLCRVAFTGCTDTPRNSGNK